MLTTNKDSSFKVPDDVLRKIRTRAKKNGRTIRGQAAFLLNLGMKCEDSIYLNIRGAQ